MVEDAREAKRGRGRPTKLNEAVANMILGHVRCGAPVEVAARAAGIHRDTYYEWVNRGEREPDSIYGEFSDKVREAEAFAECEAVKSIYDGAQWVCRAWWLERTRPKRYALRKPEPETQEQKAPVIWINRSDEKDKAIAERDQAIEQLTNRIAALESKQN